MKNRSQNFLFGKEQDPLNSNKNLGAIFSYALLVILIVTFALSFVLDYENSNSIRLTLFVIFLFEILVVFLNKKSRERLAIRVQILTLWGFLLSLVLLTGGISSPHLDTFIIIIIFSYATSKTLEVWINTIFIMLTWTILLILQLNPLFTNLAIFEATQEIPISQVLISFIVDSSLLFLVTLILTFLTNQKNTLEIEQTNLLDEYASQNIELSKALRISDESLNEKSTQELKSNEYSQIFIQLLQPIFSQQDLAISLSPSLKLLEKITNSVHCGVYLLDAGNEWAELRISSNEFGNTLISQRHRFHVSTNTSVNNAIQYRMIQQKKNIGVDSISFQDNPFMESNYELVFPLLYQGDVLGALEFQNVSHEDFNDTDEIYLKQIATILAMEIYNRKSKVKEIYNEQSISDLSYTDWASFINSKEETGYIYQFGETNKLANSSSESIQESLNTGKIIHRIVNQNPTITIPVKSGSKTIAAIRCSKRASDHDWTKAEIQSLENIANQLNIALNSARLYENMKKQTIQKNITSEISTELRHSMDLQELLKKAVGKIGETLGAQEVSIRFATEESEKN